MVCTFGRRAFYLKNLAKTFKNEEVYVPPLKNIKGS